MNKLLTISILIVSTVLMGKTTHAQQYSIKDRWNIKTDYGFYPDLGYNFGFSNDFTPVVQVEANYGVLDFMEVGVYSGFTQVTAGVFIYDDPDSISAWGFGSDAPIIFYGVTTNIHLFPFILKSEKFRIDFYVSGKLGGFYIFSEETGDFTEPERGNRFDYGVYGGLSFYIGEHWGIYGEYGYGNYCNSRVGLTFKF
ncbi:MAG TPA: hypothetical protein PLK12_16050 [Prolixibacteraceae bacterium]|nr:hypothetical protein [Prolixibacteraceae bacterium]